MNDDEIARAIAIGQENEELIALGKAWCTRIRTDRSLLGVGMLEQATGLPITGGRFTCDYARNPTNMTGMRLGETAVSFYENNCRGCPDRSPGGRIPNLGTWAEQVIQERTQRQKADSEARRAEEAERRRRNAERKLVGASLSAADQELIELVNRLDLERPDEEAADALRTAAQLAPETFSDAVRAMLHVDARQLTLPVLVEVLVTLGASTRPDELHSLCVVAASDGWGGDAAFQYLAEHGTAEDLSDELLDAVVLRAAPAGWMMARRPGEPATMLHYHTVAPQRVEDKISSLLRHGESWRRGAGAAAAQAVFAVDGDARTRLLSPLLDALRHHYDQYDDNEDSYQVASAVGDVLSHAPAAVAAAIDARWDHASPAYRCRLISCLDQPVRQSTEQLPIEVARTVTANAIKALSGPDVGLQTDFEDDYQSHAADLLKSAIAASPSEALSQETLLWLALLWIERARSLQQADPEDLTDVLTKMSGVLRIDGIVRDLRECVIAAGHHAPSGFIAACADLYRGSEARPDVRTEIIKMTGVVAAHAPAHIQDALPLIYTAMLGDAQETRAAGIEAAAEVMTAIPPESIPPLLAQSVVAGLGDQYLAVVMKAAEALRRVPADLVNHRAAAVTLLQVAHTYAPDRLRERLVEDAITSARHLSRDDEELLRLVQTSALHAVRRMPAHSARDFLRWSAWLRNHDHWADVAIESLRADDDPRYEHLGAEVREELIRRLGEVDLSSRQVEALASKEKSVSSARRRRSVVAADVLAEHNRPDLSVQILQATLDAIPDTIEKRRERRSAQLALLRFELEKAIRSGDRDRQAEIVEEVEVACAEE